MMTPTSLTHRARLEHTLARQTPDRVPVALWRHFPVDDQSPDRLAAATAAWQRQFDYDLVKISPSSSFCLRDWGVVDEWRGDPEGTRAYTRRAVQGPEDWERLAALDPTRGALGSQLECIRLLVKEFSPTTPLLQTIFSPLSQAKNLVGPGELITHIHRWPDAVHAGLRRIADVTAAFLAEVVKSGVDGVFYAVQQAQYGLLSESEFDEFGRQYDLPLLEGAQSLWLNMVHLHGTSVMFSRVVDYPVAVVNWHDRQSEPDLRSALDHFPGTLCGGLRQWETMVLGTPANVTAEARDAIAATGGKRLILGTGCVTPTTAPYGNLLAARRSVES